MDLLQVGVPQRIATSIVESWDCRVPSDFVRCATWVSRGSRTVKQGASCDRGAIDSTKRISTLRDAMCGTAFLVQKVKSNLSRMDEQGRVPSVQEYIHMLRACTLTKDLAVATLLHAHVCRNELELNSVIGEMLVTALLECRGTAEAMVMFNRLLIRTDLSWTAVISWYSRTNQGHEAFRLYHQMQREGVTPNKYTFISLLKVCGRLSDLEQGKQIHAEILKHGLEANLLVGTALLDMYGKCGSTLDAQVVFEAMLQRNVVAWNALLAGFVQQKEGERALVLYAKMLDEGVRPDQRTFVSVLKACIVLADMEEHKSVEGKSCKAVCLAKVKAIHAEVVAPRHELDQFVATTLIHAYSSCGSNVDAKLVFDRLLSPEVVAWTALIAGYVQDDQYEAALHLFAEMQEGGVWPNEKTIVTVLNACAGLGVSEEVTCWIGQGVKSRALHKGQVLHAAALALHHDRDVFVANTLIDMYSKCGSTSDARRVFDQLCNQNIVSWNAMITGYVLQGKAEMALKLYTEMHDECVTPNDRTYVSVLKACGNIAAMEDGVMSVKPSSLTRIREVHSQVIRTNHAFDPFVAMALIEVYAVCGSIPDAKHVFDRASPVYDVGLWTVMIAAYAQQDEVKKALQLFAEMQQSGLKPTEVMLLSILKACGKTGALCMCRQIEQEHMNGRQWSLRLVNSLIHTYGKCASMKDAHRVFNSSKQHDVVSWSALIAGYARQGHCKMSLKCFDEMQQAGVQPNSVTFLSLLAACSHAGLVDEGLQCFQLMMTQNIAARIEHYISVVDLLGRAGFLSMVERIILEMPIEPDLRVWLSLLGACRKHCNVGIGRRAFDHANLLDPTHGAAYLLMSSIYDQAQMFEDKMEIEDMRLRAGARKKEAQCWIEHATELHTFVVNRSSHARSFEICKLARELNARMCVGLLHGPHEVKGHHLTCSGVKNRNSLRSLGLITIAK